MRVRTPTPVSRALHWGLLIISLAEVSACATSTYQGGSHAVGDARLVLGELPPEWRIVHGDRGLTFRRSDESGTVIMINASCRDVRDAPLDVFTNQLLFGLTDRVFDKRELVPFAQREAERTTVTAKLDGVPIKMATLVLKKDWCVYDAVYAADPKDFAAHEAEFESLLAGFRILGRN